MWSGCGGSGSRRRQLASHPRLIVNAAGSDYNPEIGIQPSNYAAALEKVYTPDKVIVLNDTTFETLFDELVAGNIVIVDIKVNENTDEPSTLAPNFAHFAWVLGMDMTTQEIYLQNTINGNAYWTVSLQDFENVWERPETTSSDIPDPVHAQDVTHWAVILDRSLIKDSQS